jgi:hypothetical protein
VAKYNNITPKQTEPPTPTLDKDTLRLPGSSYENTPNRKHTILKTETDTPSREDEVLTVMKKYKQQGDNRDAMSIIQVPSNSMLGNDLINEVKDP